MNITAGYRLAAVNKIIISIKYEQIPQPMGIVSRLYSDMKKFAIIVVLVICASMLTACGEKRNDTLTTNSAKQDIEEENQKLKRELEELKSKQAELDDSPSSNEEITLSDHVDFVADSISDGVISITDEGSEFIDNNPQFFFDPTAESVQKVKSLAKKLNNKELNKNIRPFLSQLVTFKGAVVQISEEEYDESVTLTTVLVGDEDFNFFTVFLFGSYDVLEEDYVSVAGLPLGGYSFENTGGGYTNAQLLFGSVLEKIKD
ncbi:hypothetical protein [Paenibacillus apiarius]|uniref:hypothetical protein n=1 Tax=Paenibacillus apiarius TaxID=46240 RepID=UPI003B3A8DDD